MGFEVPVSGVDRPRAPGGRLVTAGLLVLVAVVAIAIATSGAAPAPRAAAVASPAGTLAEVARVAIEPARPRSVPAQLSCRDVDQGTCRRMAAAALGALPDDAPDAVEATVWHSLLCNSSFDCPPSYIDGSVPLGSVIIRFADHGPRAAVNVVDGRPGPIQRAPRAWVVRWMAELG